MDKKEIAATLTKTDPFEILPAGVINSLAEKIEIRTYQPGTYVFKQGNASLDALFVIASGLVEMIIINERGDETVIGLKRSYDFFGETVALSQQRYPGSIRAKETLTCCLVSRKELEKLMYTYPEFCGFFNVLLAERMRVLYEELILERSYGNYEGISAIDSNLFRKRVSEVMSYPPITCSTGDLATDAAAVMAEKNINAVVALDSKRQPRGILTDKNLVNFLIAKRMYPVETCKVEKIMFSNFMQITPQSFIGQALVAMMRSKTEHLIVVERNELVGTVSMADLIRTQSTGTLLLTKDIESQPALKGLILVSKEIRNVLGAMVDENAEIHEIFDVMSELYERLTRRIIQLSEEQMKREGWGNPPVEYCWINMGSAARYEQVFMNDMDNAIIYADPENDQASSVDGYFKQLAELIVDGLHQCGFEKCTDGIMPVHAAWRRSSSGWHQLLHQSAEKQDEDYFKMLFTLLDCRPIWGNSSLPEKLKQSLIQMITQYTSDSSVPVRDMEYQPPISVLGTFLTEKSGIHKNEMNLKSTAVTHLVSAVKIMAVMNNIDETTTIKRLERLVETGVLDSTVETQHRTSFENLMMLIIHNNLKKIKSGKKPDNYVDPYSLRKKNRMLLKDSLNDITRLIADVHKQYQDTWFRQLYT